MGGMQHKEERVINLQDESPFKNRTHKSSTFCEREEHLISPQEMLLQTFSARRSFSSAFRNVFENLLKLSHHLHNKRFF